MKKSLLIVLAVLVLGGLIWYGTSRKAAHAPEISETEVMEDSSEMMDDGVEETSAMPDEMPGMEAMDASTTPENVGEPDVVIEMTGKNFEFSEDEVRVKRGDTVKIVFTSESGFHDWVVDEFDAHTARVQTGETTEVTFVADKAGTFEYYCSVGQHRLNGMVGNLIVE